MLICSNCARVTVSARSLPWNSASISTLTCCVEESCFLTSSDLRRSLEMAFLSDEGSRPVLVLNFFTRNDTRRWSKSSPPRCVSPDVAFTSKKPESMFSSDTSKVPPPRSYTRMFCSFFLSSPYAMAAAVGSLMMRSTFSPEITPASRVAWRCESLKYAGTVMTACCTSWPR
jgi:hypothetical protein